MIGRLLGHNHQNTTARYAHLRDDPVDELNATIGATIAAAIGMAKLQTDTPATKGFQMALRCFKWVV